MLYRVWGRVKVVAEEETICCDCTELLCTELNFVSEVDVLCLTAMCLYVCCPTKQSPIFVEQRIKQSETEEKLSGNFRGSMSTNNVKHARARQTFSRTLYA